MTSPVRLGVFPAAAPTRMGVFNQRFEASFPHSGALGCTVCLALQLFLPVYLYAHVGPPALLPTALLLVLSARLHIFTPSTGLDECFLFNSWLSDFRQFKFLSVLVIFCLQILVVLLSVVRGGTVHFHFGWKSRFL